MRALLAIAILLSNVDARAQTAVTVMPANVQELMVSCQVANRIATRQLNEPSEDDFAKLVSCFNYTEGVSVGFMYGGNGAPGQRLCLPQGTTIGQRAHVFTLWAQSHPENWNTPAFSGVIAALEAQWPCGR